MSGCADDRACCTESIERQPLHVIATARALAADAACAEVVRAWQKRSIDSILLKGPTTAMWLYRDEPRAYNDSDLLVAPDRLADAEATLGELGFVPATQPDAEHSNQWTRSADGSIIDLHSTIWGTTRPPHHVWNELQDWVEPYRIGPATTRALRLPARALHLALHAGQHPDVPKPREDLRRALKQVSLSDWRDAERLAERLWALPLAAYGLQLEPVGRELLRQLPLARAGLVAELEDAPLAIGFARLAAARGLRAKVAVLAEGVLSPPPPSHSTGGIPMPAGSFRREIGRLRWLFAGLVPTIRSIRRARAANWPANRS